MCLIYYTEFLTVKENKGKSGYKKGPKSRRTPDANGERSSSHEIDPPSSTSSVMNTFDKIHSFFYFNSIKIMFFFSILITIEIYICIYKS